MQTNTKNHERGAAWKCSHCEIWWGSQVGKANKTRFLMQIPANVAEGLPWDEYRGWKETPQSAELCPSCGAESKLVYIIH